MSADRCPTCDHPLASDAALAEWNRGGIFCETIEARDGVCLSPGSDYCETRAVASRAKDRDDARSWRNAIEGAKEPGDPVLRAIAELLTCTYLDAVPTPADDDMRRELAVAARIANDERRAKLGEGTVTRSEKRDAAKWRKVEPLIEALRGVSINDGDDPQELEALRNELIAAAKEPS